MIVPFSLRLTAPVRLMLLDLADDPVYAGFEIQWVDSAEIGGAGIVVLAMRRADGSADVHVDRRLSVPQGDYEIGTGLHSFTPTAIEPARFDITRRGVQIDVGLTLADGRELQLRVHEARTKPRPLVRMLAPAGHSMRDPHFFPFFWMDDIWFLRWPGARMDVRLGGRRRRVVRAGAPWRLARYATAPMTGLLCEATSGPVHRVPDQAGEYRLGPSLARVTRLPHSAALTGIEARRDARRLAVTFDPPFPSLADLPDGPFEGRVSLWAADRIQVGGAYRGSRDEGEVSVELSIDQPWDPGPQPPVGAAVFRLLPVFRSWPTTYRWTATFDLTTEPAAMSSRWFRTTR